MGSRGAKLHELEIEDNRNYIVTGQILDAEVLQGKNMIFIPKHVI